MDVTRV